MKEKGERLEVVRNAERRDDVNSTLHTYRNYESKRPFHFHLAPATWTTDLDGGRAAVTQLAELGVELGV